MLGTSPIAFTGNSAEGYALKTTTSETGLSVPTPVGTLPSLCTVDMPSLTRPKIVCLPSNQGVGASEIKNCDPLVLGPALAMERTPAPVCFRSRRISSSNLPLL